MMENFDPPLKKKIVKCTICNKPCVQTPWFSLNNPFLKYRKELVYFCTSECMINYVQKWKEHQKFKKSSKQLKIVH